MAVVGKGYAVLQSGKVCLHGLIAWLGWAFIHITFLAQLSLKISVFLQWAWLFVTGQRGSRLIVNHHASDAGVTTPMAAVTGDRAPQPLSATTGSTRS
jgi:hypothetical protein